MPDFSQSPAVGDVPRDPTSPYGYTPAATIYAPRPVMPPVSSTRRDLIFAALTALFCVLSVSWALIGGLQLGFTVCYWLLMLLSTAYLLPRSLAGVPTFSLIGGALSLVSSLVFTLYVDPVMRLCLMLTILVLTAIYLSGLCGTARYWQGGFRVLFDVARTAVVVPFAHVEQPFRSFFNKQTGSARNFRKGGGVLLGLLCALPVLFVVTVLLMSADAAFEGLIRRVTGHAAEWVADLLLGGILTPLAVSLLFALRHRLDRPSAAAQPAARHRLPASAVTAFLGALCACYAVFLFSQLAYFFSAFQNLLPANYVAADGRLAIADYAIRGFFEMCALVGLNLALLFVALVFTRRSDGRIPLGVRLTALFISLFSAVLVATAFSKMALYISSFGLTRLRVLTCLFMVILLLAFAVMVVRLFAPRFPYMKVWILAACVVGLTAAFADVDTVIARYNVQAYRQGALTSVDVEHLSTLSDGAVPALLELAQVENPNSDAARHALRRRFEEYYYLDDGQWVALGDRSFRAYNLTKARTAALLYENRALLDIEN